MKPTKEQLEEVMSTPDGMAMKKILDESPELSAAEERMNDGIKVLAQAIADHINIGFQIMADNNEEVPTQEEMENMKFRMCHTIVEDIPSQLGPAIADVLFPDGWAKVAARRLLGDLLTMVQEEMEGRRSEETEQNTVH